MIDVRAAAAYAKVDRRIIPFLFLCYILAYLDRVNVGFAKLQMSRDLALSDAAFATGAGIFFIGYFFFEVPSNLLLKRVGARRWIARIMVSWGIVSAATMVVTDEWTFYAMRFILGLAEAGFFPGVIFYLTLWYPSARRATRTAGFVSAIAVAGVIGNPLSGLIMDQCSGVLGLSGWQWLFLIEGLPSIAVGIWVIFYLDSSIAEAKWLSESEKALLEAALAAEEQPKRDTRLIDALRNVKVYVLSAIYFTLTIGLYGITFWLPTIINGFGVRGYFDIGLISAIPYGVAVIGMLLLSRHSDRTGERRWHLAGNLATGAAGLVLSGVFADDPMLAIVFISIGMLGVIGSIPLFWPIPSAFLGGTAAAAGIAMVNALGNLGGFVGPNVPIWVQPVSESPQAALYVIAAILLLGGVLTLLFIPPRPGE
jgi:MFS family permease